MNEKYYGRLYAIRNIFDIWCPFGFREFPKSEKEICRDDAIMFMKELPHKYHEENILHGILIENIDEYGALNDFLPFVDNWAVCDTVWFRKY